MANVTARFVADFSSFQDAVKKADISLKNVEADANKVAASLNRMVDNFSGRKLINDANLMTQAVKDVGGATALTEKEMARVNSTVTEAIAKYTALGKVAPQEMVALADATKKAATGTDTLGKATTTLGTAAEKTGKPVSALSGWFTSLGTQLVSTAAGFVSAQAVIGLANKAFDLISSTIRESITAFAEAESAQTKLVAALKSQHQATPEVISQYNALASQFQDTTVFSDDLINSMQGLLVQVGGVMPSKMEAALKASTDLAAGLGIDLETATTLVAKAAAGHTETLGKYGIQVSEAEVQTKGLTAVLEAVNKQFGGQAAAQMETYAGRVQQAANAWNNLQEMLGKFIVQNPIVVAAIRLMQEQLGKTDKETAEWKVSLGDLFDLMDKSGASGALVRYLEAYIDNLNQIATAWDRLNKMPSPFAKVAEDMRNMPDPGGLAFFKGMVVAEEEIAKATKKANEELTKYNEVVKDVATTGRDYADVVDEIDGRVVAGIRYYLDRGVAVEKLATMYGRTQAQVEAIKSVMEAEQSVLDKSKTEWDAITTSIDKSRNTTVQTKRIFDGMLLTWEQMKNTGKSLTTEGLLPVAKGFDDISRAARAAKVYEDELEKSHEALRQSMAKPMALPDVHSSMETQKTDIQDVIKGLDDLANHFVKLGQIAGGNVDNVTRVLGTLTETMAQMAKDGDEGTTMLDKFKKGWDELAKSEKWAIGIMGGLEIADALTDDVTRLGGALHGAAQGAQIGTAILPGWGTAIGAAIGGIAGLFQNAEKQINKTRAAFVESAGGLDALRDKATAAGTTINALLNAKNAKEYTKAVKDLDKAFKDFDATAEQTKATLEKVKKSSDDLKGSFDKIGGALSASMREALGELSKVPGLSADAKQALLDLANTGPNFKALQKTAEEYGISLEMLGPTFEQAHLTDTAQKILSDFENLKNAGADVGGVINGMANEIQDVVKESLKFGTEIPENMRPMIQALIDSNQLFDNQGEAIKDIGKLKFGAPVATEADKIVQAIKDLGEIIKGLPSIAEKAGADINKGLNSINPNPIHVPVVIDWKNPPDVPGAALGGLVTATGIQNFAGGGRVLPFRARGTDTVPAMLTPGEGILSRADMLALGGVAGFKSLRSLLRTGGSSGGDSSTIEKTLADIRSELRRSRLTGPAALARAVRDEVQKAGGRR